VGKVQVKPRKGRVSLREQIETNNKWDRFYALMNGLPPRAQVQLKAKRVMSPRVADGTYESDIQRDIIEMLRKHPKVRIVERHNSGTAVEIGADGQKRFIKYNNVFKVAGVRMRKADIDCTLTNGKRFVVEVKRLPWKAPTDQREREQENYINHVKAATGYGMFATSVQQVRDALDAITI
jgi:hypothetical protein